MSRPRSIAVIVGLAASGLIAATMPAGATSGQPAEAPPAGHPARKVALLVGIDEYKSGTIPRLRGAVRDVDGMRRLLVERFGFLPADVVALTDSRATREGIVRAFREHLVARAGADTVAVFYFSGHGSRVVDVDGDELDGWDETIVPYDSREGDVFDIDDDLLGELFEALTSKTRYVTAIFDSGLTGLGVESAKGGLPASPNAPSRGRITSSAEPTPPPTSRLRGIPEDRRRPPAGPRMPRRPETGATHSFVRIFASEEGDQAYESWQNGAIGGVLTHSFVEEARRGNGSTPTYRDLIDRVTVSIRLVQPGQRPGLDGTGIDRVLFGTRSDPTQPYVLATRDRLDALLFAGRLDGLAPGAVYDLFPPGTKSFDDPGGAVARVGLTEVGARESRGRLITGRSIPPAARAVQRQPGVADEPVRLRIDAKDAESSPVLRDIRDRVARIGQGRWPFRLVGPAEPADFIIGSESVGNPPGVARQLTLSATQGGGGARFAEGESRAAERLLKLALELDPRTRLEGRQLGYATELRTVSKIHAIYIGIDRYKMGTFNLRGCVNDAKRLAQDLAPVISSSHPLHDDAATREAILNTIEGVVGKARANDLIVLFISSHGALAYNDYFVVPHDFDPAKALGTGLPFVVIAEALASKPGVMSLIVIDSCHSGQTGFNVSRYGGIDVKTSVMVAASPEELASEKYSGGAAFGIFTRFLGEGFDGGADENEDGKITIREVFDYAYTRTKQESGGRQHPVYFGSLNQNIVLKDLAAPVPAETNRRASGP